MSRIVIIDPYPSSQCGIAAKLEQAGHTIAGMASNGMDGLKTVRQMTPDLVVLDLDIPRLGGLDVIRRLISRDKEVRILVFTAFAADVYEHLCMSAGALGFVDKHQTLEVLTDAVGKLLSGKTFFNASALHIETSSNPEDEGIGERLTAREITVLHYLADGLRVKEIADEMAISDRTVSTYKARLLEKTNTRSLVDLLRVAAQHGLLTQGVLNSDDATQVAASLGSQFGQLLDQVPYPICLRDAQRHILALNRAMQEFLGIDEQQLLQATHLEIGLVEMEHFDYARKTYDSAVEQRIPYMMVIAIQVRGERRVVKHSGVPIVDDDGTFLGMLCTTIDIGEQQRELEALREQLAYLHAVRKRRGHYLIEHSRAMTNDMASLKLLLNSQVSSTLAPMAGMLMERLQDSAELLNELVQLEQGLVSITPYVADLNQLTLDILQNAPVTLLPDWDFVPASHGRWGWVDAERYAQLLRALLLHARNLGCIRLTLHADTQELDIEQVNWCLRLLGPSSERHDAVLPSSRWLLAEKLTSLLNGRLNLTQDASQQLEIQLILSIPRATPPH